MSFTERAGLFPVLLLTGCAQPVVVTGPPSGSVVDSMLSRSASDISAMQYRLHQSSPSAQRPKSATAPAAPLMAKAASRTASPVKASAGSALASLSGAGPSDGFIRDGGAAPTLRAALRQVTPPGQTVLFDKKVSADAPELWRWTGNDRWPFVINKMLAPKGLKATVNGKTNTVTVEPAQQAQSGRPASPTVIPESLTGKAAPSGAVKPLPAAAGGKNPFRGGTQPGGKNGNGELPVKTSPAPLPQLRDWRIERGTTLRQGYESWAAQETCQSGRSKWTVRWDTETNYPVPETLTFRVATFEEATTQLFNLYRYAKKPLFADGYRQQCLIVIGDTPQPANSAVSRATDKETR